MIENVRQFYLKNSKGQTYDMTRPEALFWQPDNIGWGIDAQTTRLGMTYYVERQDEVQPAPTGNMVFRTYDEYTKFLRFCQVGGLVLYYSPAYISTTKKWYCLDVAIQITKSEINFENNHLICPVVFTGLSYWYELKVYRTITGSGESGKTYNYSYPYTYGVGAGNILKLNNNLPSYFKLFFYGTVTNPKWEVVVNGVVRYSGKINATITNTQKLIINTNPKDMYIWLYDNRTGASIGNMYQNSDFSTQRIFALPAGECSFVVSSDDETPIINARLEVMSHL